MTSAISYINGATAEKFRDSYRFLPLGTTITKPSRENFKLAVTGEFCRRMITVGGRSLYYDNMIMESTDSENKTAKHIVYWDTKKDDKGNLIPQNAVGLDTLWDAMTKEETSWGFYCKPTGVVFHPYKKDGKSTWAMQQMEYHFFRLTPSED